MFASRMEGINIGAGGGNRGESTYLSSEGTGRGADRSCRGVDLTPMAAETYHWAGGH